MESSPESEEVSDAAPDVQASEDSETPASEEAVSESEPEAVQDSEEAKEPITEQDEFLEGLEKVIRLKKRPACIREYRPDY